jgi:phosphatidylinositol dimannoside acyltransferase
MRLFQLATSRYGPHIVMLLCRLLPLHWSYRLGEWLASLVGRRPEVPFTQGVRANLAVLHGVPESDAIVDAALRELLRHMAHSYVDLFRAANGSPEQIYAACQLDAATVHTIETCRAEGQGLVLVGAHTCSFDILLLALRQLFPSVQALTLPDPQGSSVIMNDIRDRFGIEVTPISVQALRQAVERLRSGGVVAVAADVPADSGEMLTFFGREARLPVGHARLALDTGAQMVVGVSHCTGDGQYRAELAVTPRPASTGSKRQDSICWAQAALTTIEGFLRRCPDQWLMPKPLWKEG